jgi:pimeloyl-ACP methyl ester carboxylesterase
MKTRLLTTLTIAILCFSSVYNQNTPADITGVWLGKVQVTEQLKMRFGYVITRNESGELKSTLNIIEQKAFDIPMEQTRFTGDSLLIDLSSKMIRYAGAYDKEKDCFSGYYSQAGKNFPLDLTRVSELPKGVERPQTPQRPFPYSEEEVSFTNPADGVVLSGTLTFPAEAVKAPAVILIAGSGKNDRNGTGMGHFLLLSDYLTRNGFVVLRSDKRGVGKSSGNYAEATTLDFASDISAALDYLKNRKEVDPKKMGLIGHSEGSLIAPMIASSRKDIAFMILLGAVGMKGDELLLSQIRAMSVAAGRATADIDSIVTLNRNYYGVIRQPLTKEETAGKIKQINPSISEKELNQLLKPWIRYYVSTDPTEYLRKVKCPVLAVNGSKDLQCVADENLPVIEKALKMGGNRNYTMYKAPELNHLLQTCSSGSPLEYDQIPEIIAPSLTEYLLKWLKDQVN